MAGAALLAAATAAPAQISRGQSECLTTLNKALARVSKIQAKEIGNCLKDGAKGSLAGMTVEACTTADREGKLDKARQKAGKRAQSKCRVALLPLAATDAETIHQAALAGPLALAHDLFGGDLDAGLLSQEGPTKKASKCQLAVAKAANKCARVELDGFNRCAKDALSRKNATAVANRAELEQRCLADAVTGGIPDPKGRIAKACTQKLGRVIAKKCAGVDQATALPGRCVSATPLGNCLAGAAGCRVCLALNRGDSLRRDCGLVDNGLADAGCSPRCGDGVLEFAEECDDGNTIDGDGCSAACLAELPFTIRLADQNMLQNITPGAVGFDDLEDRLSLLAEQIAAIEPDIITLQEATFGPSGGPSRLVADLQARFGLQYFAAEFGIISGNAVLSKWPVTLREMRRLPSEENAPVFSDRRFAARVEVASPIGPLDVYAMHLCASSIGCTMDERVVQAQAFLDFVEATHTSAHPAIIGADFNAHTGALPDAQPGNDPPIDLLQSAGWISLFDGFDAPCAAPGDRSGCTSEIDDLTVTVDTTTRRIDDLMIAPASIVGALPAISTAVEIGPTGRFGAGPFQDPNPQCHFSPRLACGSDADCPTTTACNANGFCVHSVPVPCASDADCPGDIAPELCRTTLWISDHVGVMSRIAVQRLP